MKRLVIYALVWTGIFALIYSVWVLWEIRHLGYITPRSIDTIMATALTTMLTQWVMAWAYPLDPNH